MTLKVVSFGFFPVSDGAGGEETRKRVHHFDKTVCTVWGTRGWVLFESYYFSVELIRIKSWTGSTGVEET